MLVVTVLFLALAEQDVELLLHCVKGAGLQLLPAEFEVGSGRRESVHGVAIGTVGALRELITMIPRGRTTL